MASKFFKAFNFLKKKSNTSKIAPTITQPRQLKKTMEKIRSENKRFAFKEAKTAKDRANIVRTKKSIERMNKLQKAQDKRKEGIKASKEVKKMIGTGQADRVGGSVYHRGVREKKMFGGRIKKKKPETKEQKSIKEKILPKKKKDRLDELRKELGLKKGGSALKPVDKKKNPGLAKLPTQVRNKMGYMKKGGSVRKFGGGKK
jgi:hypothetical protein